ncbi:MAG: MBL fold metallo-hydrolase, partial [Ruminococcaceae bacterium]|nr:MBL fold metallo-hydrolase [Oscillospiraceae bacterium]
MIELLYGKTRTYLVGGILLVDTDWAGTLPRFFRKLKESNIPLESIRCLMVTHYHPDHMGIAAELMMRD